MSENAEASPREATAEPSFAEVFDPAALEARLAEARARREAALARRAAQGGSPAETRGARVRTLDMTAVERPARDVAPALPPAPPPAAPAAPPAKTAPAWPAARPGRPAATPMAERLAAVVSRPLTSGPRPQASPPAGVAWHRQPLAILGLGLVVGGLVTGGAFVAIRPQAPDAAALPQVSTRVEGEASPFAARRADDDAVGATAPPPADVATLPVPRYAPPLPGDAALPRTDRSAVPNSLPERPVASPAFPGGPAVAALSAVEALPPLELTPEAPPPPAETATREPQAAAAPVPAPEPGATAPSLPAAGAPPPLPAIAAVPGPPASDDRAAHPDLRFATAAPPGAVRAALSLPGEVPLAPPLGHDLFQPAAEPARREAPAESAARPAAEARAPARSQPQPAATRPATPVRTRTTAADAANRERLERDVEDMLRDRLFGD